MSNQNRSSDTSTTKLVKIAVLIFLLGNAFANMLLIEDMQTQINELKLNYVLTCNGVNN